MPYRFSDEFRKDCLDCIGIDGKYRRGIRDELKAIVLFSAFAGRDTVVDFNIDALNIGYVYKIRVRKRETKIFL